MSFLFASSHLPETRVQRPEDEEEDDVQPMLHSGSVRAFSHLPAKRVAADSAGQGPLAQRGARALGHQFQRTETEDAATPHEDGIAAAKASGVFDAVRQQFNRDDSPHFMDEDGNLRPRQEPRQPGSPAPRDPRSPQFGAGAPPRPAWSTGNAAGSDSSRSLLTKPHVSDNTTLWHTPPITPEDLDSLSVPKGKSEALDFVYRTQGASPPKPEFNDLAHRINGSPEEARDHRRDYLQNVAAAADSSGHLAQQTNTYGAATDNRGNGSSYGHADNAGSGSQPATTAPSTYKPYRSIFQDVMDGHKKYETEAEPTVEMLEQAEKHLQLQVSGAELALHKHHLGIQRLREIRDIVEASDFYQDRARKLAPELLDFGIELGNKILHLDPEEIIEKINAAITQRKEQVIQYQNDIAEAKSKLQEAIAKTEAAKIKKTKHELEEKRRQQLEEKKRQQLEDQRRWESEERARKLQELKEKHEQELERQKHEQELERQRQTHQPLG